MPRSSIKAGMPSEVKAILAVLAVLITSFLMWVLISPYYSTHLLWFFRENLFWGLPLFLLAAAIIVILGVSAGRNRYSEPSGAAMLGATAIGVVGLAGFVLWLVIHSYQTDRAYAATIKVTGDPVPQVSLRAPYGVANAQARPNLGGNPGDLVDTTYIPNQDHYTSLVLRRGTFSGYSTILDQKIPLTGRGNATRTCDFSPQADMRMDGNLGHNLGRYINADLGRGLSWSSSDVYGYCQGDTPMVVVPLTEQDGWAIVTEKPAGAAIYNGKTGALSLRTNLKGIPGPSYSLDLAAHQRESAVAIGGFSDWWWNRTGWELSQGEDNFNSGDAAEFVLNADGRENYITPLTGRGSATSISAISMLSAQGGDRYNPLVVHRLAQPWVSPSSIADRVRADYQDIPNQQNIGIMEVIPRDSKTWVATLGTGQNILYRATGNGKLEGPRATCLQNRAGEDIRCGSAALQGSNGVGTQYGSSGGLSGSTSGTTGTVAPDADLAKLSPQKLIQLQNELSQELSRRLSTTGGTP